MSLMGFFLGTGGFFYTNQAIRKRAGVPAEGMLLGNPRGWVAWAAVGAIVSGLLSVFFSLSLRGVEVLAVLAIVACLSIIDNRIRKIANELLAALLVLKVIVLIAQGNSSELMPALIGFAAGFILFILPSMLKINIGWGDVKYAGVVGFYLGLTGLFQAIFIMSISLGVFAIYLILSKKGNMRTMAPMGPAFSLGFFATILFPIITNIYNSYGG